MMKYFNDIAAPGDISSAETDADDDWRALIGIVLDGRIQGETRKQQLSEPAKERFFEVYADTVRGRTDNAERVVGLWPEQVLKIALLLHLAEPESELPVKIGLATMEAAIGVTRRLGAEQLRIVAATVAPPADFEAEIEVMIAKVRLHGRPLKKRDLFRKYNAQEYGRLEPILALCQHRQQLKLDGDLIYPALPG